jgi:hypothetical protein
MATITITTNKGTGRTENFENVALAEETYRWYEKNMELMNIKQVALQTPTYFYRKTIEKR